jgi:L-rhamnose mutarotase
MTAPSYDDVNLILRLYEMRREDVMREARKWFQMNFRANTMEQCNQLIPPGSDANAYFRQVTSYWEMVASFVNNGVLNFDIFAQSGNELLFVYERLKHILPAMREASGNPKSLGNLEAVAHMMIDRMHQAGPKAYESFAARVA